ncbi:hypothetical protein OEZ85_011016 [Tetradesmus obliquus]|uniref:Uncharacterized protein n=1 Tax=Tetradesmus obliquus TaxID=3088 RepID=A0ABY8TPE8_TETOB|nr:hypothetical protein OEZ85_011016 [Tetradesmus obliquus]
MRDPTLPSPLLGQKLTYSGHMAHLAALVAPAVEEGPCAMLESAIPYSCIARLASGLPEVGGRCRHHAPIIGELARSTGSKVLAWAGERWISTSEFVIAAGIAATKVCGKPALARHKAVVVKHPGEQQQLYVLRLAECRLAGEWQRQERALDALILSFKEHPRHTQQAASRAPSWRQIKELVMASDALRAAKRVGWLAKRAMARVLLHDFTLKVCDTHEYGPAALVQKPHYFFSTAFDPAFMCKPRPARLVDVPAGVATKAEVRLLLRTLRHTKDLVTRTSRALAGKGYVVPGAISVIRALRAAIQAVQGWQHHEAAKVVQAQWRTCVADPSHRICKSRLLREFHELTDHTTSAC